MVGWRPGSLVGQDEALPVACRSSSSAVFAHGGVVVEDPGRGDADEHLAALAAQFFCEGDAVIAGVEDEQRHLPVA